MGIHEGRWVEVDFLHSLLNGAEILGVEFDYDFELLHHEGPVGGRFGLFGEEISKRQLVVADCHEFEDREEVILQYLLILLVFSFFFES